MTGSPTFSTILTTNFERSLKKLIKRYKGTRDRQACGQFIAQMLKDLCQEPRPSNSAIEPLPGKTSLPQEFEFRKLRFNMPGLKGASGQGRLMYLLNFGQSILVILWIYTHEEFEKRPEDKSLKDSLQDALATLAEEANSSIDGEEHSSSLENQDPSG